MSKNVSFQFTQKEVLLQAKLRAYYLGESLKDDKLMEIATKLQANDDDDDVLVNFALNSSNKVIDVLNPVCIDANVVKSGETGSEIYKYDLTMVSSYADSQTEIIKNGVLDYMINWTLYEWLSLMSQNSAKLFFDKCAIAGDDIRKRINKRLKPEVK